MRIWVWAVMAIACGGGVCPNAAPTTGDACAGTASSCTYADACTGAPAGVVASCTSGRWEVAYDLALVRCPTEPVHDGDPCPCGPGARQEAPCSWECPAGDTERAFCDPRLSVWVVELSPTSCSCPATKPTTGSSCQLIGQVCSYASACHDDPAGVRAQCVNGNVWDVGSTAAEEACPTQPVADGDPCPCGDGMRQQTPCSWSCTEGYTRTAACDPTTLKWTLTTGTATCTL